MDILLLSSWKMLFRRRRRRDDTKETASPLRRRPLSLFYSCSFIDNDGDGNVFFVLLEKRSRYFPGTTTPNDEDENISFLPFLSSSFDASRKTRQNAISLLLLLLYQERYRTRRNRREDTSEEKDETIFSTLKKTA